MNVEKHGQLIMCINEINKCHICFCSLKTKQKLIKMRRVSLPQPLSEGESKLFDFVINSVKHLDVTLRVAGGWVRDQMLGRPSDDIDITIETPQGRPYITGEQIANALAEATQAAHHPHVSVIKTNPEKSKHIETAQVTIMGHHLEFC